MAHQTEFLSAFNLDKPRSSLSQSLMYGHNLSHASVLPPSFSEFDGSWSSDSSQSYGILSSSASQITPKRWQEQTRRNLDGSDRLQQSFLSDCRTTIHTTDSPSYQPLLLPSENIMGTLSGSEAHVPRGVNFIDCHARVSNDAPEPTASSQWNSWNFPYSGRTSPEPRLSRSSTGSPDWPSGLNLQIPPFDAQSWNSMILSASDSSATPYTPQQGMSVNGFIFPHRLSPLPSPSPPPTYHKSMTLPSAKNPPFSPSHRGSIDSGATKKCSHCQATSTPLWRRDPSTLKPLCNACGLYLQQRNKLRPQELIDADTDEGDTTDDSDQNYVGPECSHCRTHHTSVWRRSKTGAQLCNACGVYARLRGKPRPLSLKRNKIKPRSKHAK